MTMVSSGQIALAGNGKVGSLNQSVEVELGGGGTSQISLNDGSVRTLLGVASGQISLNSAYGKSSFSPIVHTYRNSAGVRGNETVPTGAAHLTATCVAAGAGGASPSQNGGGSGGFVVQTIAIASADWGASIPYVAAKAEAGGFNGQPSAINATLTNGTLSLNPTGGQVLGVPGSPGGNPGTTGVGGAGPLGDGAGTGGGATNQPSVEGECIFEWT